MKTIAAALAFLAFGVSSGAALAEQTPFQVRARAVQINTADKSDPVGGVGASDRFTVSDKTILDVDFSYYFTPNIAAELVLTTPQKHTVYLDGASIGTFKHLPPTLTLQYHFAPNARISPYVGAGINYTRISSVHLLNGAATLENHSTGFALQAGADFKLNENWSINLDVKKLQIRSDVYSGGTKISRVKIDPVLFGIGIGYRF